MIAIVIRVAATSMVALSVALAASSVAAQSGTGQACGPAVWSTADQRHTVLPCTDPSASSERSAHIGE